MTTAAQNHHWPAEGLTRVPYWISADPGIYEEEQARIFQGPTWSFLCLEAELPGPNTYRRSNLGAMPVVVTRDKDGALHAFENRCAHRGSLLVLDEAGEARNIICVYHNWSYDLAGNLTGVAFRRGLGGKGGTPSECRPELHGPRRLRLETIGGLVFGTLADDAPALENYLGREISARIRRVMRAPARLLGGYSQVLHSNWKLYMENVKDTYHASLLHTFFTTFRLNRLSQKGGVIVSDCGGHHVSYALAEAGKPAAGWGRGGEGGRRRCARCVRQQLPPPLAPPHKGEGNTPIVWRATSIPACARRRKASDWRRRSCWSPSMSSAMASACRFFPCSRASYCNRPATAWRCAASCRRASIAPSSFGRVSALPTTTMK